MFNPIQQFIKKNIIGQILHRRATTTQEIRSKIKQEKGTIDSIAKKYNIS